MEYALLYPHLRTMDLLEDLPDDERAKFINSCRKVHISEPTSILTQGSQPDTAFVLAKGAVEVSYESDEKHKAIIGLARPPSVLGLIELVAERPYAATCTAFPGTDLLQFDRSHLAQYLQHATFIRNFASTAYSMLRHDNHYKAVDQFYTAEQRICEYLEKFACKNNVFCQNQSYLANAVGCTRQTVNKELSLLREREVIAIQKGEIHILNPNGLRKRVAELDTRKTI